MHNGLITKKKGHFLSLSPFPLQGTLRFRLSRGTALWKRSGLVTPYGSDGVSGLSPHLKDSDRLPSSLRALPLSCEVARLASWRMGAPTEQG